MVHVHGDIQPTPDGAPDSKDLFKYAAGAAGGLAQIKLQNVKSLTEVLTNEQMHQII